MAGVERLPRTEQPLHGQQRHVFSGDLRQAPRERELRLLCKRTLTQVDLVDGRRDQIEGVNHQSLGGQDMNMQAKERLFPCEENCNPCRGH